MKTSVEINDSLARRVRALMRKRGTSLRALIEEGLRRVVEDASSTDDNVELRDASVEGDGLAPGIANLDWDTASSFLYPEPDAEEVES